MQLIQQTRRQLRLQQTLQPQPRRSLQHAAAAVDAADSATVTAANEAATAANNAATAATMAASALDVAQADALDEAGGRQL